VRRRFGDVVGVAHAGSELHSHGRSCMSEIGVGDGRSPYRRVMLVNTSRHSSQVDMMRDAAKKCSYHQTIGLFWHGGCRGVLGGADPVLYTTNYPSKLRPILFTEQLSWDVRQSFNTRVPELYLLFEMVCNYG
jgi:hypothetical protein